MPTETEIYILPNGEVVIADLPAELAETLASLSALLNVESSLDVSAPAHQGLDDAHVAH